MQRYSDIKKQIVFCNDLLFFIPVSRRVLSDAYCSWYTIIFY